MDPDLPRRLIARQFPQFSNLPVTPVESAGTDNHIWRLGPDRCIRMPKVAWAADSVARECAFLPRFQGLPLAIPTVIGRGEPDQDYPFVWSVCEWIAGEAAGLDALSDPGQTARDLAAFILALRAHDAGKGPVSLPANNLRGGPLSVRDARTREAIDNLSEDIDAGCVLDVWERALAAPRHDGPGVWIHSDLKEGNLLMRDGRLAAVIDFGMLAVGDPAVDVTPAWSFFEGQSREAFLAALNPTPACIARAKGWAVTIAATAWDYYRDRNPDLTRISRRTISNAVPLTCG